jgi:hypothetical protein
MSTAWRATLAVLAPIGANDGDVVHRIVADLSAMLADAVDRARNEDRRLVMPELQRQPIASPWSNAAVS